MRDRRREQSSSIKWFKGNKVSLGMSVKASLERGVDQWSKRVSSDGLRVHDKYYTNNCRYTAAIVPAKTQNSFC